MEQYALEIFSVVLNLVLLYGFKKYSEKQKNRELEQAAIKDGLRALLRQEIIVGCARHLKEDSVTMEEFESITLMYKAYKGLNGNGAVDALYDTFIKVLIPKHGHTTYSTEN